MKTIWASFSLLSGMNINLLRCFGDTEFRRSKNMIKDIQWICTDMEMHALVHTPMFLCLTWINARMPIFLCLPWIKHHTQRLPSILSKPTVNAINRHCQCMSSGYQRTPLCTHFYVWWILLEFSAKNKLLFQEHDMFLADVTMPFTSIVSLNWLIGLSLTSREHASGYMRRPCKGHVVGCLWLVLPKPIIGDEKWYENHRHKCVISTFMSLKFPTNL